jgi:hypothetical protein
MRKNTLVAMTAMVILVLATVALAADPHVGTWKLNIAKSKASRAASSTLIMKAQNNGLKCASDFVDSEGKATHAEWAAKYDGKDYPVKGNPDVDAISLTKIDANTVDYVQKKSGKEVQRGRTVVSTDGKTYALTGKAQNSKGQDVTFTAVFDKQ